MPIYVTTFVLFQGKSEIPVTLQNPSSRLRHRNASWLGPSSWLNDRSEHGDRIKSATAIIGEFASVTSVIMDIYTYMVYQIWVIIGTVYIYIWVIIWVIIYI